MRRVVSLFLPTWPTDRIRKAAKDAPPQDEPLVTAMREGSRRVVAAVDAAAAALGLRPGLTVAHAQALVPNLHVIEAAPDTDGEALRRLARWCFRYSPLVAVDPPDGIWIESAGSAHLFGGEEGLLADLAARLRAKGLQVRLGLADTPGAAWATARFGRQSVVPPGGMREVLAELPVAGLRLGEEAVGTLHRLGVERIGQLAAMPRAPLARRFGPELLTRLDQALGRAGEPLEMLAPPEAIACRAAFAEPLGDPDDLARVVRDLATELVESLTREGVGARRLDLVFHRVDGQKQAVSVGTARPSRDPRHLARLLTDRLETVDPGFGIEEIALAAPRTEPLDPAQLAMKEDESQDAAGDVADLVDRLAARVGSDHLYRCAPVESEYPERSVARVDPLAEPAGLTWPAGLPRPSRLVDPPEPLAVIAAIPDHAPSLFTWRRIRHRVVRADGPERVFAEWWRSDEERAGSRDYYQVEDEAGARFWVFRDGPAGQGGRWWLHGLFG
jgi:protein ImuB